MKYTQKVVLLNKKRNFINIFPVLKQLRISAILTGICTNVPLLSVGYENNGTTGTVPFLRNIGPCIGVTVGVDDSLGAPVTKLKINNLSFKMTRLLA